MRSQRTTSGPSEGNRNAIAYDPVGHVVGPRVACGGSRAGRWGLGRVTRGGRAGRTIGGNRTDRRRRRGHRRSPEEQGRLRATRLHGDEVGRRRGRRPAGRPRSGRSSVRRRAGRRAVRRRPGPAERRPRPRPHGSRRRRSARVDRRGARTRSGPWRRPSSGPRARPSARGSTTCSVASVRQGIAFGSRIGGAADERRLGAGREPRAGRGGERGSRSAALGSVLAERPRLHERDQEEDGDRRHQDRGFPWPLERTLHPNGVWLVVHRLPRAVGPVVADRAAA